MSRKAGAIQTFGSGAMFDRFRNSVPPILDDKINLEGLEEAHFETALLLRSLSFGGFHNFNSHSIVKFYLNQKFNEIDYTKIDKIRFDVPVDKLMGGQREPIERINKIVSNIEGWEEKQIEWAADFEKSLNERQSHLNSLEDRYNEVLEGRNFLGLSNAFRRLIEEKISERNVLLRWLILLGGGAALVPLLYLVIGNSQKIQDLLDGSVSVGPIAILIFSIVFEALMLYYFRLLYSQWRSVKQQILQLKLRHEMCAFTSEYAREANNLDRSSLNKFENLVFSELFSDTNVPPSIYDAADAVSKIIGSMRRSEK